MGLFSKLLAIVFVFMLISLVLYVVFGQLTVKKLRKNPKTNSALGMEFVSGWDIINVAQALALPASWVKKMQKSPISFLDADADADADVLRENTTKFDRALGAVFYWMFTSSGLVGMVLVLLDAAGLFD